MKRILQAFLILALSITFASIIWPWIKISYNSNYDFGGEYLAKSYNAQNDTIRFVSFICLSILPFLFFYKKNYSQYLYNNFELINLSFQKKEFFQIKIFLFLILLILAVTLDFFLIDFSRWISPLDIFHEGLWITSSLNYLKTGNFWTASFFDRGIFGNFYPVLSWKIFGIESIGAVRFTELFILYLNKILLIFLSYNISRNIIFDKINKLIFFIFLSILLVSLTPYYDQGHFVKRSLLILFFLNFLIISFVNHKYQYTYFIILGFFSNFSVLWFYDVGAYINFIIFCLIILLLFRKNFKELFSILTGIFISWFIFWLFTPIDEFKDFIFNISYIYATMDQIHGLIYPIPFFSGDTRATKTLLMYVLGGVFTIFICLDKNKFNNTNKIFFLFLYLLALVSFKTGLSRSDSPHIKTSTGPLLIIIYTYLLFLIFNNKLTNSIIKQLKKFKADILFLTIIIFFSFNLNNFFEIKNFNKKFQLIIQAEDAQFLRGKNENYIDLLNYFKENFYELECIQVINDDIALPYLLKKKSCTKFYEAWILTPLMMQNKFIREIEKIEPEIIIAENKNQFTPNLFLVEDYLNNNYYLLKQIDRWVILKKN